MKYDVHFKSKGWRPVLMKKMNKLLIGEDFKSILDVGGTQNTYDYLKEKFPNSKVISINLDPEELPKENAMIMNAEDMGKFEDNMFDFLYVREVLEHIYRPDKFLEEAKRVLKPGGKIMVSTPNLNSWHVRFLILFGYPPTNYTPYPGKVYGKPRFFKTQPHIDHVRVFPYRTMKKIFDMNGFKLDGIVGVSMYSEDTWMKSFRKIIGAILPNSWQEGILVKATVSK
jgi:ubiquinone/menaquinone biosynthesis C-methylase UbiE